MKIDDDVPGPAEVIRPYPRLAPVRNIGPAAAEAVSPYRLIAVEGPDGAGKTTQIELLKAALTADGWDVRVCAFIRNPLIWHAKARGKYDNWDPYTMALMYAASLVDLVNREVLPHLGAGGVVIMDRYLYSVTGRSEARGCGREWLTGLLAPAALPHRTLHLRTPVAECFDRKAALAPTFSYWECGVDVHGDDALRVAGPKEAYRDSFIAYQQRVQDIVEDLLKDTDALGLPGAERETTAARAAEWVRTGLAGTP
ncbi:dTMP kinase [Streptomyces sp. NPDC058301]|uniref:dTMP kinase n=1 Tax=Streptomyces sp. NPDC058301 TaxID=3346436 RepID=UPI0036E76659